MSHPAHNSGKNTRRSWLIAAILVLAAAAPAALAQTESPAGPVAEIRITGNETLTDAYIRQQLRNVVEGQPATVEDIRKDVDLLKLTGKFADVYATSTAEDAKTIVTFTVVEKPLVQEVRFQGAKEIKRKDLLEAIGFDEGDFLDRYKVQAGAEAIAEQYREKGYTDVTVTVDEESLRQGVVAYNVIEGPRVRVREINFEGNVSIPDNRLKGQIQTRTYFPILRPGTYAEKQIEEDIAAIRTYYRKQGHLDVQVGRRLDYSPDREDLTVTFVVDEGPRYSINEIAVAGNQIYTTDQIMAAMALRQGSVLLLDRLEADQEAVRNLYHSTGFIYANVDAEYVYADQPATVNLAIQINEGDPYRVGRIIIRGNDKTQDRVVRRTLEVLPGEPFDMVEMKETERRLKETRLFSEVDITAIGEQPEERDALIQVEEAQTSWIIAGVGVSSNSGTLGNISIENWNFDLFDWPRTWGELFRGQAFKGAGQSLRFSVEPGTEMSRFRIDFREPYLLDRPLSLGWSAYLFDRERDDWDERRAGTILSLGKRFKKIWGVETGARFEGIDIDDINDGGFFGAFGAPEELLDVEGGNFLTSLKLSLVRDTTDSVWMPSRGNRSEVSWEQAGVFGGDFDFAKLYGQHSHYRTVRTDVFDRKTIWAANLGLGYIAGDVPVFERFYGGGIGSIRGFEFRGISPRAGGFFDDEGDIAIGGDFEVLVNNELSFPLYGKNLRGVLFLDQGTVEENISISSWRAAAGFGVRLTLDFFGPVPMAFNFAWPVLEEDEDETQVFSFTLGAAFR